MQIDEMVKIWFPPNKKKNVEKEFEGRSRRCGLTLRAEGDYGKKVLGLKMVGSGLKKWGHPFWDGPI